jgi:transcriptional regulator with GAF, ATPase, and Fis domain
MYVRLLVLGRLLQVLNQSSALQGTIFQTGRISSRLLSMISTSALLEATSGPSVGEGAALRRLLQQVNMVAPNDATVLIFGETGTGKELIVRAVHERSRRRDKPLVRVNCSSIPKELFESEFFGHARGAFTGAIKDRAGRFEVAAGGTLFLDEVGEIPLQLHSKLLRVLLG